MLNYLKNFAVQIVPSVAATVIGAYIVNHYINGRPAADAPKAAAVSTAQPKSDPTTAPAPHPGESASKAVSKEIIFRFVAFVARRPQPQWRSWQKTWGINCAR